MGIKSWLMDRKRVSMEKHEIDYIKRLAKKYLKKSEGEPDHHFYRVRTSSLRRMCKYILKTRPKTRKSDRLPNDPSIGDMYDSMQG